VSVKEIHEQHLILINQFLDYKLKMIGLLITGKVSSKLKKIRIHANFF
jgi:hypothetical protein